MTKKDWEDVGLAFVGSFLFWLLLFMCWQIGQS